MIELIDQIQNHIFAGEKGQFAAAFIQLVEELIIHTNGLSATDQENFSRVLNAMLSSYENKDFLLLADLLEFELKPRLLLLKEDE